MTYETLQYVDAGGTTHEVAVQNLGADTVSLQFVPRSHAPGQFHITFTQAPEVALAIPFKSRCIVRACRTSASGANDSFSGGTILFQGRRTDSSGEASQGRVSTSIVLSDALWDLSKITYQVTWNAITGGTIAAPTYTTFYFPDVILFQASNAITYNPAAVSGTITTWQQIQDIIRYAQNYITGDDAIQLQLAGTGTLTGGVWSVSTPEFTPSYCNWYPVKHMKCLQALTTSLRPHPGVFTYIDHTTTPPTLHFRDRAHMTPASLPYKYSDGSITHIASSIQPLPELVPDRVALYYQIQSTYNGQPVVGNTNDVYPVGAGASLLSQEFSINVTGASTQQTQVNFVSAAFDPTSKTLWRQKIPALTQISDGGQVADDGTDGALTFLDTTINGGSGFPKGITVVDETGAAIDLTVFQYITNHSVYTWMKLASGVAVQAVRATVTAHFKYKRSTVISATTVADTFQEHRHHFKCVLTNALSGTYILSQLLRTGESIPANLAQNIYNELQPLQWRLRHQIIQVGADASTVPTLILPGCNKINLFGGSSDWASMNAVPENVTINFRRIGDGRLCAEHSISCGPVNHLEPGYLVQLFSMFSNRDLSKIDANQRITGSIASSQVDLSANTIAVENSTADAAISSVQNQVGLDTVDNTRSIFIQHDATSGQIIVAQKKTADGTAYTSGIIGVQYTGSGVPDSGRGTPYTGPLATGAYYRTQDRYWDTSNKQEYICTTAGDKAASGWKSVSSIPAGMIADFWAGSVAYSAGAIVQVVTTTTYGGITILPGTYVLRQGLTTPVTPTGNQIPQYPYPLTGTIYWMCIALGVQTAGICASGGSATINFNGSASF